MIQNIFPHQFHNEYSPKKPQKNDYVFDYDKNGIISKDELCFFQVKDIAELDNYTYLFTIDQTQFFYMNLNHLKHNYIPLQKLRSFHHSYLGFGAITASHIIRWYQENQYCGKCAYPLKHTKIERSMYCENCHNTIYPKISPAVIVAIINQKNQILLTKYATKATQNYALVAGYTEIGETIEETVKREVQEETGLKIKNITYYGSQPWGISSSILMGFWAIVDGNDIVHINQDELSSAIWKTAEEITAPPEKSSLSAQMIWDFKYHKITFEKLQLNENNSKRITFI